MCSLNFWRSTGGPRSESYQFPQKFSFTLDGRWFYRSSLWKVFFVATVTFFRHNYFDIKRSTNSSSSYCLLQMLLQFWCALPFLSALVMSSMLLQKSDNPQSFSWTSCTLPWVQFLERYIFMVLPSWSSDLVSDLSSSGFPCSPEYLFSMSRFPNHQPMPSFSQQPDFEVYTVDYQSRRFQKFWYYYWNSMWRYHLIGYQIKQFLFAVYKAFIGVVWSHPGMILGCGWSSKSSQIGA